MTMSMEDEIRRLNEFRGSALLGGGKKEMEKQHKRGKLTVRERIDRLFDSGSFAELGMFAGHDFQTDEERTFGDGIVAGYGKIDGRMVCIYGHDATVHRGSVGTIGRSKMCDAIDTAIKVGVPFVGLNDAPGARIEALRVGAPTHGYTRASFFYRHTQASGVIPQISAILGTCAGNAVYAPALTDFIIMVDGISHMMITGPRVIKTVTGEDITMDDLGGPTIHHEVSGVCDFRVATEDDCFHLIRRILSFLPSNNAQDPPRVDTGDDPNRTVDALTNIVPLDTTKPFDVHQVISLLVDNGDFLEVKAGFAKNIVVGFCRLDGRTVGIVANQPMFFAGALTVDSSDKDARFIRFCDAFNIPLIFLVDNPGYFPGVEQEHAGIIRHGAKVLYAIGESVVPKLTVIMRRSTGGGGPAMGCDKDLGIDRVFAWPTAHTQVIGPEAMVEVIYKKEIAEAENSEEFKQQKIQEVKRRLIGPYSSAAIERVDEVIEPGETRSRLITSLELMATKRERRQPKKHGNIPL